MHAALTIAGLALALTAIAGCSEDGSAGAPTDASVEDFCANFQGLVEEVGEGATVTEAIQRTVDDMIATGTPEDISDDAREGWEVAMEAIQDLDDDATEEELENLDKDFSESDQRNADAFDDYVAETCEMA